MTIPEAIKLLTELRPMLSEVGFDKYKASVTLGIEALEWIKGQRDMYSAPNYITLPGETTEQALKEREGIK